jgi:hypothetical protein
MTRRRRAAKGSEPGSYPDEEPPTVVSIEWDYGYPSVLANVSPGVPTVDLLDPADLGLSPPLVGRLKAWLERQEVLSRRWYSDEADTEESLRAEAQSRKEKLALAYDVQHELSPDVEVLLEGQPISEYRHR